MKAMKLKFKSWSERLKSFSEKRNLYKSYPRIPGRLCDLTMTLFLGEWDQHSVNQMIEHRQDCWLHADTDCEKFDAHMSLLKDIAEFMFERLMIHGIKILSVVMLTALVSMVTLKIRADPPVKNCPSDSRSVSSTAR